jgi:hypothetical protein
MSSEEEKKLLQGCEERLRWAEESTAFAESTLERMHDLRDRLTLAERIATELRKRLAFVERIIAELRKRIKYEHPRS